MEDLKTDLSITPLAKKALHTLAYWGKFLAIVGYISVGFMIIGALIMKVVMSLNPYGDIYAQAGISSNMIAILYLIMAIVYFFPVHYLFKFSTNIRKALNENNEIALQTGLENLASNFKFVGIMTIVTIAIYILFIIIMSIGAATAFM